VPIQRASMKYWEEKQNKMRSTIAAIFIFLVQGMYAQPVLSWMELSATRVHTTPDMRYQPDFFQGLNERNNTEVTVTGYIIPMDVEQNTYVLSMTPFSNCFFCGQAGVETVIDLHFADSNVKFKVDDYVVLSGFFRLNKNPGQGFIYSMRNVKVKK